MKGHNATVCSHSSSLFCSAAEESGEGLSTGGPDTGRLYSGPVGVPVGMFTVAGLFGCKLRSFHSERPSTNGCTLRLIQTDSSLVPHLCRCGSVQKLLNKEDTDGSKQESMRAKTGTNKLTGHKQIQVFWIKNTSKSHKKAG